MNKIDKFEELSKLTLDQLVEIGLVKNCVLNDESIVLSDFNNNQIDIEFGAKTKQNVSKLDIDKINYNEIKIVKLDNGEFRATLSEYTELNANTALKYNQSNEEVIIGLYHLGLTSFDKSISDKYYYIYIENINRFVESFDVKLNLEVQDLYECHIERILDLNDAVEYLVYSKENFGDLENCIITNDYRLNCSFQLALTENELIKISGYKNYIDSEIRYKKLYHYSMSKKIVEQFIFVKQGISISITDVIEHYKDYPIFDDRSYWEDKHRSLGWLENYKFKYFKHPNILKKYTNDKGVLDIPKFENYSVSALEKEFNLYIAGLSEYSNSDEEIKHFDRANNRYLILSQETLTEIKESPKVILNLEMNINKDYFIEYKVIYVDYSKY